MIRPFSAIALALSLSSVVGCREKGAPAVPAEGGARESEPKAAPPPRAAYVVPTYSPSVMIGGFYSSPGIAVGGYYGRPAYSGGYSLGGHQHHHHGHR